ncbi:MAG: phosphotransferase family protein [Rhodospirillales bacterium]
MTERVAWAEAIADFVRAAAGADAVSVDPGPRLAGGAIQENLALSVAVDGGAQAGAYDAVLRTTAASSVPASRPLGQQFALLRTAHTAGVPVPEPLWHCDDAAVIGRPFYLMRRLPGIALGSRVVRGGPHDALARQLAQALARIHAVAPPRGDLAFLEMPSPSPALFWVATFRRWLDGLPEPHPVLEWGLRWLARRAPPAGGIVLCHHDFRTGNYLVSDGALAGVLDWEFAGWSDPMEDIGWFCAKCWRFGASDRAAGGIADRETFYRAYESASGRAVDREAIPYWEVMAHVRWAVIALQQAMRHRSGAEPSLELALIARRLPELEHEILAMTGEP